MATPTATARRESLAKVPLFSRLARQELDALAAAARTQRIGGREELFHKGDAGSQVFVVLSGRLKVVTTSADADDVVFSILGPGEVFGELALLRGSERTATVTAIESCELLVLDRRDFLPFLRSHPDVAIKLLEVLAERLSRTSEFVEDTLFLNLPSRLAKKLLSLRDAYGSPTREGIRIDLGLSQQELGDLVGATRESINKQMRSWREDGLVSMERGVITILRPDELEALAGAVIDSPGPMR